MRQPKNNLLLYIGRDGLYITEGGELLNINSFAENKI